VTVSLADLKAFLSVTHDEDDVKLAMLLSAAEDELLRYLERSELPDAASVDLAVCFLCRAGYDAETADESARWRDVARTTCHSYRTGIGA
jgi:hypothetical protein